MSIAEIKHRVRVPLNALDRHHAASSTYLGIMADFLADSRFIHGSRHACFEREFASYCGARTAFGVANGTDAIEIALRALEIGPGDEVITVANAGFYTSTACFCIGAVPVYADIDPAELTMCPQSAAQCVTRSTKALVATHLYGKMADIEQLMELCSRHGIPLIEDCAQAHGAERCGRKAGAWGTAGTFSFYPTKNLGALGDGGAVTTSDDSFAERVRLVRQYGWTTKYECVMTGRNSRLDELQAAFLCDKLPMLDSWNRRRREIVRCYHEAARGQLRVVHGDSGNDYAGHLAVARHPARNEVRHLLNDEGIETAVHYPIPDHRQPCLAKLRWRAGSLSNTEDAAAEIFSLPCFPEMTEEEVDRVCYALVRVGREIG